MEACTSIACQTPLARSFTIHNSGIDVLSGLRFGCAMWEADSHSTKCKFVASCRCLLLGLLSCVGSYGCFMLPGLPVLHVCLRHSSQVVHFFAQALWLVARI
eukprot:6226400-Amphidinium_carterae.1